MFHHHDRRSDEAPDDSQVPGGYGGRRAEGIGEEYRGGYGDQLQRPEGDAGYGAQYGEGQGYTQQGGDNYGRPADLRKERREEVEAGLGATTAGAFALHEDREAREHPEHERRHKVEEEAAEGLAAGGAGYGVYEHEKRKDAKDAQEASGYEEPKKHHGWFH